MSDEEDVLALKSGEEDLVGRDFSGEDFSGENFSGRDFTDAHLKKVNFDDCDLSNSKFNRCKSGYLTARRANLTDIDFSSTAIGHVTFESAQLLGASFARSHMHHCDFRGADLRGADFQGANIQQGCEFENCIVDANTNFDGASIFRPISRLPAFFAYRVERGKLIRRSDDGLTQSKAGPTEASANPAMTVTNPLMLSDFVRDVDVTTRDGVDERPQLINDRISKNRTPILLISQNIGVLIQGFRETIRGNNALSTEKREHALQAVDQLLALVLEAESYASQEVVEQNLGETQAIKTWPQRFGDAFDETVRATFEPKNVAQAAVPTAIILGCGALGALIGGPVGFGAGSVMGHLISGQIKPGQAVTKLKEALNEEEMPSNSDHSP